MSLIRDVKDELAQVEQTDKSLRLFSLLMLAILFIVVFFQHKSFGGILLNVAAVLSVLFVAGIIKPQSVKKVHLIWMGFAFILGWFVSRILLTVIYFIILTPIGLIARVSGKRFVETKFVSTQKSYWKKREHPEIDFEKMS